MLLAHLGVIEKAANEAAGTHFPRHSFFYRSTFSLYPSISSCALSCDFDLTDAYSRVDSPRVVPSSTAMHYSLQPQRGFLLSS